MSDFNQYDNSGMRNSQQTIDNAPRFCSNCGAKISRKVAFCTACGTRLEAPVEKTAPIAQAAPVAQQTVVTRVAASSFKKPASFAGLGVCLLVLTAAALLFAILRIFFVVFPGVESLPLVFTTLFSRLLYSAIAFVLPVVALVLNKKRCNKVAKVLMIVSIVVLGWQILAVIVYQVLLMSGAPTMLTRPFGNTNGSILGMSLLTFFHMGIRSLRNWNVVSGLLEGSCFLVKNILQVVLFAKLAKRK